jgi:hypothetical protein
MSCAIGRLVNGMAAGIPAGAEVAEVTLDEALDRIASGPFQFRVMVLTAFIVRLGVSAAWFRQSDPAHLWHTLLFSCSQMELL